MSDHRVVWEGTNYRVQAYIASSYVNFRVEHRPAYLSGDNWYWEGKACGERNPRWPWQLSIPEAGRRAVERAIQLQQDYEEAQRAVAEVSKTVDALVEVQAIVEAL